ncbi:hypothetical protein NKJ23_33790, partial [Mesorhizobium sp. M0184]|uniref:hypothetical protein n=1 Tax=Mesorhizobium sp. M0184 TaxID=2956906 RepID=UPI00333E14C7
RRLMRLGKTHRKGNQIAASGRRKLIAVHQAGWFTARHHHGRRLPIGIHAQDLTPPDIARAKRLV